MNDNIVNNGSKFIEQSCNEITKNIMGGINSPIEKAIINNLPNLQKSPLLNGGDTTKTSYIFLGYEMSSTVFIILMIILLIITLYVIYKLFKWMFSSNKNEFVSIKKYIKNRKYNTDSENDEEKTEDVENTEDDDKSSKSKSK